MTRNFALAIAGLTLVAACRFNEGQPPEPSEPPAVRTRPPAQVPRRAPELGSFGIDLSARKASVRPGDDFYEYANGAWLDSYQLKPDEMRYGAFIELEYRAEDQVKAIIDELSASQPVPGTNEQKIADYFASFMDRESLNRKGVEPLRPELEAIAALRTREQLVEAFGRSGVMGSAAPIASFVEIDRKDPNQHRLNVIHSGLGLPNRDYYLEDGFAEVRAKYQANIQKLLELAGTPAAEARLAASKVLLLETEMAKLHWPESELRELDKTHNPMSVEQLEAAVPAYAWRRHWRAEGIDVTALKQVNVMTPSALGPLANLIRQTPLSTWKHYLVHQLVKNHAELLGDVIDDAAFEFHGKVLNGQPEQRERWKRGIELVGAHYALGEAIGRLYVARHFPPESKQQMDQLVQNLREALRERIALLDWMSQSTKAEAFEKLDSFNPKIGYPKKWRDFSSITIAKGDLMANTRAVRKYWHDDEVARLARPTDRDEWYMDPQTVNAYYNPSFNEIVFPAAILQPPFFDPNADGAVNYGAIGAVIGHEMGHGFDDQGSKSDAAGVQRNWWTETDRRNFEARTRRLVEQYDRYEPLAGHRVNGQLTLGENIGDLGGLSMAYHAYQRSLAGRAAPVLEGFTGPQRFFLSWAQVWRLKMRDEFLVRVLKSDPHSPARFRVNGIVRNMDAWYSAFDV
ncbi:MAG TPA: M13 family metallopeptidase, partial [Polyangiaceae bacterium]|nr:M13 family metallopeptidase [Polyangiaceae bacterium]